MQDRKYLLSIEEFLTGENREHLLERAFSLVDEDRRQKAERIKKKGAQAACLGAGLLLQLAVQEALDVTARESEQEIIFSETPNPEHVPQTYISLIVSELLEKIRQPMPITYHYGENGKPYLKEYPFFFNLSHSGNYVFCVLSSQEVGTDIQQHSTVKIERIAERFFTEQEITALEDCAESEKEAFFFQLWARKEAYGKLTGEGISSAVSMNFLPEAEHPEAKCVNGKEVVWEEYPDFSGYSIAVCKYRIESMQRR